MSRASTRLAIVLVAVGVAGTLAVLVGALVVPECDRAGEDDDGDRTAEPAPTPPPGPTVLDAGAPQPPAEPPPPGWPYVDPTVPAGTARVILVRGLADPVPVAGATLHVVTLHLDGRAEHGALITSATGEVTITGLITDGSAAYHVLTEVDGDRLEGEPLVARPGTGWRLTLQARRPPGSNLPPLPGADDRGDVPAGEAVVRVMRRGSAPVEVELVDVAAATTTAVAAVDDHGTMVARFDAQAPGTIKVARVREAGGAFLSRPFQVLADRGATREMWIFDQPIVRCMIRLSRDRPGLPLAMDLSGALQCEVAVQLGAPRPAPAGGLRLRLPAGVRGARLFDSPLARLEGGAITWRRPLPPGTLALRAEFELPAAGGRAAVQLDADLALFQVQVMVEMGARTAVEDVRNGQVQPMEPGYERNYHLVASSSVAPASPLSFTVTGVEPRTSCERFEARWWGGSPAPQPPPPVSGRDLQGDRQRLADLRGRVVVLNLWASWCPPCTEELPSLAALQRRYPRAKLVVVALSSDPSWREAGPLASKHPELTHWLDPPVTDNIGPFAHALGSKALPETYLIDRDGNVRHWVINLRDWTSPEAIACIDSLLR